MVSLPILIALCAALIIGLVYAQIVNESNSTRSWEDLTATLKRTRMGNIALIALDTINPGQTGFSLNKSQYWTLIGEWKGILDLYTNAGVLIALAAHAERWNPYATAELTQQLRNEGKEVRRAAVSIILKRILLTGAGCSTEIGRTASSYYAMAFRLSDIAGARYDGELQALLRALWTPAPSVV